MEANIGAFMSLIFESNLKMLSYLLYNVWELFIALDGATHAITPYFDVLIWFINGRYTQFPPAGSPNQGVSQWATNVQNYPEGARYDLSWVLKYPDWRCI